MFVGLVPDKPRNLTVAKITPRSAAISWLDPEVQGILYYLSRFLTKLKNENTLIWSRYTAKVNNFKLNNLTSYTTYEISVAAGNRYGFGEESVISFSTSEEGRCEIRGLLKRSLFKIEKIPFQKCYAKLKVY